MAYDINYDDKRFTEVENDKKEALTELENTYGGMISDSDKYYQAQIDASKQWAETQKKNQQAETDFAIKEINQQKEQAKKDYTREQSGAYKDWQKQSNPYGVNAEQMASQGMTNTGFAESSQVSMFNQYQSRVTAAREAYGLAVQNYNNAITQARLQNNSILAEIAYEALQKQLELSLAGFQYKNDLIREKATKKTALEDTYYGRYQDVLKQINTENALAEEVRQYNESLAENKRQHDAQMALQREQFAWQKAQAEKQNTGGGGGYIAKGNTGKKTDTAYVKNVDAAIKPHAAGAKETETKDAEAYINALIKSGASKDTVSREIMLAFRKGELTQEQAVKLRQTYTPRGLQY